MSNHSIPAAALVTSNLYTVGSVIEYVNFLGKTLAVLVTSRERDMKNGAPGFTGHIIGHPEMTVWGLDYQVVPVLVAI